MLTIFRILTRDVPKFLRFYAILLLAFSSAIAMLTNSGNYHFEYGLYHFIFVGYSLLQQSVYVAQWTDTGNIVIESAPEQTQWLVNLLLTLFFFTVLVLMINLLIGMINLTYSNYCEVRFEGLIIEKYNMLELIEIGRNENALKGLRDKYSFNSEFLVKKNKIQRENSLLNFNFTHRRVHSEKTADGSVLQLQRGSSIHSRDEIQNRLSRLEHFFEFTSMEPFVHQSRETNPKKENYIIFMLDSQVDIYDYEALGICDCYSDFSDDIHHRGLAHVLDKLIKSWSISDLYVCLESRNLHHISHPNFWKIECGETQTDLDIQWKSGEIKNFLEVKANKESESQNSETAFYFGESKVIPKNGNYKIFAEKYAESLLEFQEKLHLYPPFCIIGSEGHSVREDINEILQKWAHDHEERDIKYIQKGLNPLLNMHSPTDGDIKRIMASVINEDNMKSNNGYINEPDLNLSILGPVINSHDKIVLLG